MRLITALLCLMLIMPVSCVSALPLSGGNEQMNAKVLGVLNDQSGKILVEMLYDVGSGTVDPYMLNVYVFSWLASPLAFACFPVLSVPMLPVSS
jgi:hypothetical protein